MRHRYNGRATFLSVYISEAHPADGWRSEANDELAILVSQPRAWADRAGVADRCRSTLLPSIRMVVDTMDDRVSQAYSAAPDRLYIVDTDGRIAYKSGRGPFGFLPAEMEQSLLMLLMDRGRLAATAPGP